MFDTRLRFTSLAVVIPGLVSSFCPGYLLWAWISNIQHDFSFYLNNSRHVIITSFLSLSASPAVRSSQTMLDLHAKTYRVMRSKSVCQENYGWMKMSQPILKYAKNALSIIWKKIILEPLCLQSCECQTPSCFSCSKCKDTTHNTKTCHRFSEKK